MSTTSAKLSDLPKDREFEEFLAAWFQCGGYFIERNIVERDPEEVLELDIIVTNYNVSPPKISLAEAKSGSWGFPDIFKIRGWMDYTSIKRAWLITQSVKQSSDFYKAKAASLKVRLLQFESILDTVAFFKRMFRNRAISEDEIVTWRYAYWAERQLIRFLLANKKRSRDAKRFPAMSEYRQAINGGIFFTENLVNRLRALYNIFQKYPRLSALVGNESVGGEFENDRATIPSKLFAKTFFECELTDLCVSTYIENSSRLAILKNAVEYAILKKEGRLDTEVNRLIFLPGSFRSALIELSGHSHFHRYPLFWQWFLWFYGGFILLDYEAEEYKYISQKCGIPLNEIPNALRAFDILFPIRSGWFTKNPRSNIRLLKGHSIPFLGIGANSRLLRYSKDGTFQSLNLSGEYTRDDLARWHNALDHLLTTSM